MKLRNIFLSLDLFLSIAFAVIVWFSMPALVKISFFISAYSIGVTVLSIVFGLFFAALTIVLTSSDDDYVIALEELGINRILRQIFQFTLGLLFVGLFYSIAAYFTSEYYRITSDGEYFGHKIFFVIFIFLFTYGLFATIPAVLETLRFSQYRAESLVAKKKFRLLAEQPDTAPEARSQVRETMDTHTINSPRQ